MIDKGLKPTGKRLMPRQIFSREILKVLEDEYVRKFLATAASRLIAACSTFMFGVFVARTLGPDNTGIFYFCLTALLGISLVARLGQEVNIVWHTSRANIDGDFANTNGLILISLLLALISSIVFAGLAWILQPFLTSSLASQDLAQALALLLLALPAVSQAHIFAGCLKGVGSTGKAALLEQGGVSLLSLIALFLWYVIDQEFSLSLVLLCFVICSYLVTMVGAWWWFSQVPMRWNELHIQWPEIPGFLTSSINMGLVSLLTFAMQSGPLILIGVLADQREVGLFAIGDRLVMLQFFIFSIVLIPVAPKLSTLFHQGKLKEFELAGCRSALFSTMGALPIAVLLLLFPTWCLTLFGNGFSDAALLVQLLCLGYLTSVLFGGGGYLLMITGHESSLRNIHIFSALLLLALDIFLIPVFGATGAAFATLLVYSLKYVLSNFAVKKLLGFYVIPRW